MNIISCPGWECFKWCWCWLVKSRGLHWALVVVQDAVIRPHPGHCHLRNQKHCWLLTLLTRCDVPHEVWDAVMSAMVICLKKGVQNSPSSVNCWNSFLMVNHFFLKVIYFSEKVSVANIRLSTKFSKSEANRGMSRIYNIYRYSSISIIGGVHQTVNQTLTRLTPMSHVIDSNKITKFKQIKQKITIALM